MNYNVSEAQIRSVLEDILDPDLNISLKELDAIDTIKFLESKIQITLRLIQPIYWVAEDINKLCITKLREIDSNTTFEILVAEKEQDFSSRAVLPGIKNIIAVSSGKGGVGKSSIAANIAAALTVQGAKVGILDGDIYGPSQPTIFGLKNAKLDALTKADGSVVARPVKKYGMLIASMGFLMSSNEAAIVRGPMLAGYFSMLFEQIEWGALDFLVFDLPPGTGDIQLTMVQKIPLTGAAIITTPQEMSLADVRRSIAMFDKVKVNTLGIIENMSYFSPDEMPDKKYFIFGEGGGKRLADEYGVALLGQVPIDPNLGEWNDSGMPLVLKDKDHKQSLVIRQITKDLTSVIRKTNFEKMQTGELEISI